MMRADALLLDYSRLAMEEIRNLFQYSKNKLLRGISNVKESLSSTSTTTQGKAYTTVTIGKSVYDVEHSSAIEDFATALLFGIETSSKAYSKSADWIDFAATLFQDLLTIPTGSKKPGKNHTVTAQDQYLLSFIGKKYALENENKNTDFKTS